MKEETKPVSREEILSLMERMIGLWEMNLAPEAEELDAMRFAVMQKRTENAWEGVASWDPPYMYSKGALRFFTYFKPTYFERRRKFYAGIFSTLEPIQDIWTHWEDHLESGTIVHPPLFKSHKFSEKLLQMFDYPMKKKTLNEAFIEAAFKHEVPEKVLDQEYREFKDKIFNEFAQEYKKAGEPAYPRQYRTFEKKQWENNEIFFAFLCYERLLPVLGIINRRLIRGLYREARKKIPDTDLRRGWLLSFWPWLDLEMRIPTLEPLIYSFFGSDEEIKELIIRVLVYKQTKGVLIYELESGEKAEKIADLRERLQRLWYAYLAIYPLYVYLLDQEITAGLRTLQGKKIRFSWAQEPLKHTGEWFGWSWRETRQKKDELGEDFPFFNQFKTSQHEGNIDEDLQLVSERWRQGFIEEVNSLLKEKAGLSEIEVSRFIDHNLGQKDISLISREEKVSRQAILCSLRAVEKKISTAVQRGDLTGTILWKIIRDYDRRYNGPHFEQKFGLITLFKGLAEKKKDPEAHPGLYRGYDGLGDDD